MLNESSRMIPEEFPTDSYAYTPDVASDRLLIIHGCVDGWTGHRRMDGWIGDGFIPTDCFILKYKWLKEERTF